METDILVAEVAPQVLNHLQALLSDLYIPLVAGQQPGRRQAESAKEEFVQVGMAVGRDGRNGCECLAWAACSLHVSAVRRQASMQARTRLESSTAFASMPCPFSLFASGPLRWPLTCLPVRPPPLGAFQGATKFVSTLAEATASGAHVSGDAALGLPDPQLLATVLGHRGSSKSLTRAAANADLVARFSAVLAGWCGAVETALTEGEAAMGGKDAEDAGAAEPNQGSRVSPVLCRTAVFWVQVCSGHCQGRCCGHSSACAGQVCCPA